MKQKAEEIYHRFVNYEWNDVGEGLKKSILEAIETALTEGQKLPIHDIVGQSEQLTCPRCNSTNCLIPDKENDAECNDCGFIWVG